MYTLQVLEVHEQSGSLSTHLHSRTGCVLPATEAYGTYTIGQQHTGRAGAEGSTDVNGKGVPIFLLCTCLVHAELL